jgi:hypothetical protein
MNQSNTGMNEQRKNRQTAPQNSSPEAPQEGIRVDGFGQVLSMLEAADPVFRESLLKRIAARDPKLAMNLRTKLR